MMLAMSLSDFTSLSRQSASDITLKRDVTLACGVAIAGTTLGLLIYRRAMHLRLDQIRASIITAESTGEDVKPLEQLYDRTLLEERRRVGSFSMFIGVLGWPIVHAHIVGFESLREYPLARVAYLLPILASLRDAYSISRALTTERLDAIFAPYSTRIDATAIMGITLALVNLLTSNQAPYLSHQVRISLVWSLLIFVATVLPSSSGFTLDDVSITLAPNAIHSSIIPSVMRRTALHYAIGLISSAMSMYLSVVQQKPHTGLKTP